jgi:hypothetical protein
MRSRRGCGLVALIALFLIVGCLVFVAFGVALVLTGEISVYAPRLTGFQPHPNFAFQPSTPITLTFDQPMDAASVETAFAIDPEVPGSYLWNETSTKVTFLPAEAGFQPGTTYTARLKAGAEADTLRLTTSRSVEWSFSLPPLLDTMEPPPGVEDVASRPSLRATFNYRLDCPATLQAFSITPEVVGITGCKDYTFAFTPTVSLEADTAYVANLENVYLEGDPWPRAGVRWEFRTGLSRLELELASSLVPGFIARLEPGKQTVTYLAWAVTAGGFTALPAEVSPMCGPEVWSRSDSVRCQIEMR